MSDIASEASRSIKSQTLNEAKSVPQDRNIMISFSNLSGCLRHRIRLVRMNNPQNHVHSSTHNDQATVREVQFEPGANAHQALPW